MAPKRDEVYDRTKPVHVPQVYPASIMSVEYRGNGAEQTKIEKSAGGLYLGNTKIIYRPEYVRIVVNTISANM